MSEKVQDVIMIGAGPSSLTAAIYTTREDINTVLYEKAVVGGMAAITDKIDNYPGFPDGVDGLELADLMKKQAERFGAKIEYGDITSVRHKGKLNYVTVDGKEVAAKVVLIASGSNYGKIDVPGEAEYYGRGVHYCATCDGAFYRSKQIIVVGGGNSAVQETIFLTRFVSRIDLLVRSTIKASEVLQNELKQYTNDGRITVYLGTVVNEIIATDGHVTSVDANQNGKSISIKTDGLFIFAGLKPNTAFLAGSGIELDEAGFIKTDEKMETNLPGVFASGDVRSGSTMQVASAVGEGATAAIGIREYLGVFTKE